MLFFSVAAVAAERWAVYEIVDGKTRVWRKGVSDGDTGAIKKTEVSAGRCSNSPSGATRTTLPGRTGRGARVG